MKTCDFFGPFLLVVIVTTKSISQRVIFHCPEDLSFDVPQNELKKLYFEQGGKWVWCVGPTVLTPTIYS